MTFGDSGELAAAAATLGIAHPPGYPLFTLLGHGASFLPVGPVVFRIGLLSAAAAAAAGYLLWRTVLRLAAEEGGQTGGRRPPSFLAAFAALAGVLLFALSRTVWSQATIVEVYALGAALEMAAIAAALGAAGAAGSRRASLPLLGFAFGLCLAHHLTAVLLLPAVAVAAFCSLRTGRREGRRARPVLARTALAALLPLLLFLYLPLRAGMAPAVDWDHPATFHRFLAHVTARQYQGFLGREGLRFGELGRFLTEQLPGEATLALPALALLGAGALARRRPLALLVTALPLAARLLLNMAYPIHDIDVYYVPVLLVLGLWAGVGAVALARGAARLLPRAGWRGAAPIALLTAALAGLGLLPLARNFAGADRSGFRMASDYVRDALGPAPPGAVVFSGNWDRFSAPALWLKEVDGFRPDVVVLDVGRMGSAAFGRDLARALPELARELGPEIEATAAAVRRYERGERAAARRANEAFARMCAALVRRLVETRPTFAVARTIREPWLSGWPAHPEGLLFRLATTEEFRPVPRPEWEGPPAWPRVPRSIHDEAVRSDYRQMVEAAARYLEHHGRPQEAQALRARYPGLRP